MIWEMDLSKVYILAVKFIIPALFFIIFSFIYVDTLMVIVSVIWLFIAVFITIMNVDDSSGRGI